MQLLPRISIDECSGSLHVLDSANPRSNKKETQSSARARKDRVSCLLAKQVAGAVARTPNILMLRSKNVIE
ncbi:MAG: hypothetical protein DCC68_20785 [Planctomycetota bacterium]|nr:MAG: hypothetical protein DCC68_20785 [Planctomycetota bacterium]